MRGLVFRIPSIKRFIWSVFCQTTTKPNKLLYFFHHIIFNKITCSDVAKFVSTIDQPNIFGGWILIWFSVLILTKIIDHSLTYPFFSLFVGNTFNSRILIRTLFRTLEFHYNNKKPEKKQRKHTNVLRFIINIIIIDIKAHAIQGYSEWIITLIEWNSLKYNNK